MSENEVTRDGARGTRPGRDAVPHGPRFGAGSGGGPASGSVPGSASGSVPGSASGSVPGSASGPASGPGGDVGSGRRRRRRRGGEAEPTFRSYYDQPILQPPVWKARAIASYFFLGGLAGASSVIGAGAHATGRPGLARASKTAALGAIGLSLAALIEDLGVPRRFLNMLRVVKPTSPMSMGTWILSAYGPAAGVSAITALTGWFPRIGAAATGAAALTGPAVASYTAVLAGDTAVPAWHDAHRQLPFVFTSSAAAAAGGFGLVAAPLAEQGPARRAAVAGGVAELVATTWMYRGMGPTARVYRSGRPRVLHAVARTLTIAGLGGAVASGLDQARPGRSRVVGALSGLALMAGSACTRFSVFEAGRVSTLDPRYVVEPQRARLAAAEASRATDDASGPIDVTNRSPLGSGQATAPP